MDTSFEENNKDDLDRDLEKVLTFLQGHPIEASNETVIYEKLDDILKELGINPTQAEKIIELIRARFAVKTNLVDYSCVSDSTSSRIILTARPRKVGKLEKRSTEAVTLKEWENRPAREEELQAMQRVRKEVEASEKAQRFSSIGYRQDRPRSFVIKGDGWVYEVKIVPGGWHSGGGGRRPHPIAYQVGSSLSGRTDYHLNPDTRGRKKRKKRKK